MLLIKGHAYALRGMKREMWDAGHPKYGTPEQVAGRYLGYLKGARRWHGFEIRVDGAEAGVIFMPEADLVKLEVVDLSTGDPRLTART